ncbi:hypothetical protein [Sporosarcina sp. BP05]|uniref:hypothetical protein n=1 Tax=Sporosarcina sp. BP05 TaxID=2758726 RepID=UPI00164766A5|nr:hypothetical protein [Sporosarcina sp. BP05]
MQEKKPCDGKELICINVDKVYDWIVKENSFDISPTGPITFNPAALMPTGAISGAMVTCEVNPAASNPIVILHRENRPFCIDGKTVLLQQLGIQKNFDVSIIVTLANGTIMTSANIPVTRCEQVILCAPEGTNVEVTYTDLDCFVCSTGTLTGGGAEGTMTFSGLSISVSTCQSIQSTFPVTVEFLADYCEPRDDLPTVCPAPMRPKQCSVVFPETGHCCH